MLAPSENTIAEIRSAADALTKDIRTKLAKNGRVAVSMDTAAGASLRFTHLYLVDDQIQVRFIQQSAVKPGEKTEPELAPFISSPHNMNRTQSGFYTLDQVSALRLKAPSGNLPVGQLKAVERSMTRMQRHLAADLEQLAAYRIAERSALLSKPKPIHEQDKVVPLRRKAGPQQQPFHQRTANFG